jgi:3-deoxy-D-manno-octulosonic-acid transferase
MSLFLDLAYLLVGAVLSPWIVYRAFSGDGKGFWRRFGFGLGAKAEGVIWLHGSSAGEVSLLPPLVELLEKDAPDTPLLISAYSSTGLAAARKSFPDRRVILFPFDFSFVVRRFMRHFAPRLIVIVESEFWPNFLVAAARRDVPVVVLNGKISSKSFRVYTRTRLFSSVLRRISLIAVQTEEHARRLRDLGVDGRKVRVTGNMKYDLARPLQEPEHSGELRRLLGYGADDVVVIGGSLHDGEDDVLLEAFSALALSGSVCSLVLVPRYPADAARIQQSIAEKGYPVVCKTAVDRGDEPPPGPHGVLLVDTLGELRMLYAAADIAFVGGSLFYRGSNKGGHNLMEPAILGVPVLFGPHNFSFKETAQELIAAGGGIEVADARELGAALARLGGDKVERQRMGERARRVVLDGQGATRRNYALLTSVLQSSQTGLLDVGRDRTMPRTAGEMDS